MSGKHYSADEMAAAAMAPEPGDDHDAIEAHAADCEACASEWQKTSRLAALMSTLTAPPPPSPKSMARTQARVRAMLASEPRPASPKPSPMTGWMVAASVLVSVVVAFGLSGPSISVARVLVSLATIGVAALLPGIALRSERDAIGATIAALSLSVALAWLDYNEYPLIAGHAVGCFETELAIGALPLVSMLALLRGTGMRLGSLASAAAGACGALAGQGVLLTTCGADESVLHVLFFHVAGVVVATVAGAAMGGLIHRRAG